MFIENCFSTCLSHPSTFENLNCVSQLIKDLLGMKLFQRNAQPAAVYTTLSACSHATRTECLNRLRIIKSDRGGGK